MKIKSDVLLKKGPHGWEAWQTNKLIAKVHGFDEESKEEIMKHIPGYENVIESGYYRNIESVNKIFSRVKNNFNEMEIYEDGSFEKEISQEDYEYYYEELENIRKENVGCILAWVVPDEDDGHIEYKVFKTWTDAEIWKNQK